MNYKLTHFTLKSMIASLGLMSAMTLAAPPPLTLEHDIDLADRAGQTYLNVVRSERDGVKKLFDADFVHEYTVADWSRVKESLKNFDAKISRTVLGAFDDGEAGLRSLVKKLEGQTFTPESMVSVVRSAYRGDGNVFALAHFLAMSSGAGTLVRVDAENYFYNFGYRDGSESDDVKSGRSYGAGPGHAANDASDIFYLNELEQSLQQDDHPDAFYRTFLQVLTATDTSGYNRLNDRQQTVATDLLAIYTAELDRHLMVDLNPAKHPWENDLAEATFVALFNTESGLMYQDGALVKAPLRQHWSKSTVSNRSGIGITRHDRRALQQKISVYLREYHAEEVAELEAIIGTRRDGDIFRALMEFINNASTQSRVKANAKKITDTFVSLLETTKAEAGDIVNFVNESQ
jgi:hypothetical protein